MGNVFQNNNLLELFSNNCKRVTQLMLSRAIILIQKMFDSMKNFQSVILKLQEETRRERPKSAPYLRLKNIQGTAIGNFWKFFLSKKLFLNFFSKKVFFRKSHNATKTQKEAIQAHWTFLQTENFKKMQLIESENFREKSRIVPKKKRKKSNETKQSFGLASTFGNIKNLWFSARIEPTISCFSEN